MRPYKLMWRREEKLGYWLADVYRPEKLGLLLKLRKELLSWFRLRDLRPAIGEYSLGFDANMSCLNATLPVEAPVHDGLALLGQYAYHLAKETGGDGQSIGTSNPVKRVDLLDLAVSRSLHLPKEQEVRIQRLGFMTAPRFRSLLISLRKANIHSQDCIPLPQVQNGCRCLLAAKSVVHTATSGISVLPHAQASVSPDQLKASEYEGFLQEAEVLKGIPANRGKVLAVFRHVPIEMISGLRFLEEKKVILYNLTGEPRRTRTRVHDLAAIRDTSNQEIHLVPHRTRYRTVLLN